MTEPFLFTCGRCGETHEGLPDFGFDAPVYYHETPEPERARRCRLSDDLFVLDETHYFVRGVLLVPLRGTEAQFGWGVWTSLSQPNFERYLELWDRPVPAGEGPYFGWLSNRLPFYPDSLSLKLAVHLRDQGERPHLELEPTDHPLAVDQREGLSPERARELVERLLHDGGVASG